MEKKKKKIKWYVVGGVLSLFAGISYFLAGNYTSGAMFVALGGLYLVMSTVKVTYKQFKEFDEKIINQDEIFIDLMQKGKKIAAIKQVRKLTNCDLLSAEKFVDAQLKKWELI